MRILPALILLLPMLGGWFLTACVSTTPPTPMIRATSTALPAPTTTHTSAAQPTPTSVTVPTLTAAPTPTATQVATPTTMPTATRIVESIPKREVTRAVEPTVMVTVTREGARERQAWRIVEPWLAKNRPELLTLTTRAILNSPAVQDALEQASSYFDPNREAHLERLIRANLELEASLEIARVVSLGNPFFQAQVLIKAHIGVTVRPGIDNIRVRIPLLIDVELGQRGAGKVVHWLAHTKNAEVGIF